jgi:hypothetical protein
VGYGDLGHEDGCAVVRGGFGLLEGRRDAGKEGAAAFNLLVASSVHGIRSTSSVPGRRPMSDMYLSRLENRFSEQSKGEAAEIVRTGNLDGIHAPNDIRDAITSGGGQVFNFS